MKLIKFVQYHTGKDFQQITLRTLTEDLGWMLLFVPDKVSVSFLTNISSFQQQRHLVGAVPCYTCNAIG